MIACYRVKMMMIIRWFSKAHKYDYSVGVFVILAFIAFLMFRQLMFDEVDNQINGCWVVQI